MPEKLTRATLRSSLKYAKALEDAPRDGFRNDHDWVAWQMAVANIRKELTWRLAYGHEGSGRWSRGLGE